MYQCLILDNISDFLHLIDYPFTQIVMNGFFSVDNFFFIGAVLVSFIFFKELKRNRKAVMSMKGWFMFYLHRIIRLSPAYYMAIAFISWVFTPFISERVGRLSNDNSEDPCNKYFWRNVLYINNLGSLESFQVRFRNLRFNYLL